MTFDDIVAVVLSQGGFDVGSAVAGGWVNEKHREAVARSEWLMETVTIGPTVAGVATYDLPANVAHIRGLYLTDAVGGPGDWQHVTTNELWDVKAGRAFLRGSGGVFCADYGSAGEKRIELFPAPDVAGLSIVMLAAVIPPTLISGGSPVIPEDMHGALIDGSIAVGLLRMDERADSASVFIASFERMVRELGARKVKRVSGGRARARFAGYDFGRG